MVNQPALKQRRTIPRNRPHRKVTPLQRFLKTNNKITIGQPATYTKFLTPSQRGLQHCKSGRRSCQCTTLTTSHTYKTLQTPAKSEEFGNGFGDFPLIVKPFSFYLSHLYSCMKQNTEKRSHERSHLWWSLHLSIGVKLNRKISLVLLPFPALSFTRERRRKPSTENLRYSRFQSALTVVSFTLRAER